MKKRWVWILVAACAVALCILCIPSRYTVKDGGSYGYESVLYHICFYHGFVQRWTDDSGQEWAGFGPNDPDKVRVQPGERWEYGGTEVKVFGLTVYSNAGLRKISDAPDARIEPTPCPTATATPEGNPYFTCTGTEYGPYPIIPYAQREAQAKSILTEQRELLELAAAELLNTRDLLIDSGEARMRNDAGMYVPIDVSTLSESLQALMRFSKEADVSVSVGDPDPVFAEDAMPYVAVRLPMAIDETMVADPGTLYYVALIYTTNTEEQIGEGYRHDVRPIDGNWFIETYFYAY